MLSIRFRSLSKMIVKPLLDHREYRHIQLPNKLEALLISDPSADKAAGAIDVRVGSLFDPPKYQGLAHFLEHMLFLGTKKYPAEDAYQSYLAQHGGLANAFTADNHTCYFFSVAPEHLEGALDRLGQFFISPLFTQSATDREVNAVNSEHSRNVQEDMWRQYQLMREKLFNPSHPSHHFATGNKDTLGNVPRSVLLDFHKAWYSSNVSKVSVLGKESLDELEEMVTKIFSEMENKDVKVPLGSQFGTQNFLHAIANTDTVDTSKLVYPGEQLLVEGQAVIDGQSGLDSASSFVGHINPSSYNKQLFVVPVKEQRSVQFGWFLPEQRTLWKSKPARYLSHILGHEGEGSLTQVLKSKGVATDLVGGLFYDCAGIALFKLDVHLTKQAAEDIASGGRTMGELTELVSAYVRLSRTDFSESLWKEMETVDNLGFAFKATVDPMTAVQTTVNALHYYPVEEVLGGPSRIYEFDKEGIKTHLENLSGDKLVLTCVGKEFAPKCDQAEPWYGTQYGWDAIDRSTMEAWNRIAHMDNGEFKKFSKTHGLSMPEPNPFLPSNLNTLPLPSEMAKSVKHPYLIGAGQFFKQDNQFHMPKGICSFSLYSSYLLEPSAYVKADLFIQAFMEQISKTLYTAEVAGLKCKLKCGTNSVNLSLNGYSDKLSVLASMVTEGLSTFAPTAQLFSLVKDRTLRSLQSQLLQKPPCNQAMDLISQLIVFPYYSTSEKLHQVEKLTHVGDLSEVGNRLFQNAAMESLVEGNLSVEDARALHQSVFGLLHGGHSPSLGNAKIVKLDNNVEISRQGVNPNETNGSVVVNVQCGWLASTVLDCTPSDLQLAANLNLVSQICGQKFFDDLRTKQQLGYIVHASGTVQERRAGMIFLVQSEVPTSDVKERMFTFINGLDKIVEDINPEDFANYIEAVISEYKEKPKNQVEEFQKHWSEIDRRRFHFGRKDELIPVTEKIAQADIVEFIRNHIIQAPKVVAIVTGSSEPNSQIVLSDDEISAFRNDEKTTWVESNCAPITLPDCKKEETSKY